jgi:DNA (cytosine-5)-methyltransferase 1
MNVSKQYTAISLFTCAGLGDAGLRESGARFIAMNEIEPDRAGIARTNFPEARVFTSPIEESVSSIVSYCKKSLASHGDELFLASCTAPCQGMSSAGMGKLLDEVKRGNRPHLDPRNALIIPALKVICELRPLWVIFENVIAMRRTLIEYNGQLKPILEVIRTMLGRDYFGEAYDVDFADYGIPQTRKRLITVFTRDQNGIDLLKQGGQLIPAPTHAKGAQGGLKKWVTVKEAISHFPALDAGSSEKSKSQIPLHYVAVMDAKKYFWVSNTPPGASAFDNQCINPDCRYQDNKLHEASRGHDGVNRSSKETPLYCERCKSLLPRPYAEDVDGTKRIMRGFTSAYRRMKANSPAPTISRNLSFVCGDKKIHYSQNRPLSVAEAIHLQTVDDYPFEWTITWNETELKREASASLIRICIAESIPPRFMKMLGTYIRQVSLSHDSRQMVEGQMRLFP